MAYRRFRRSRRRHSRPGRIAHRVARKAFRGAVRMPKRKLARVYATKCGQVSWRAARRLRGGMRRRFRRFRRFGRRRF